jgi:hypothetical protein
MWFGCHRFRYFYLDINYTRCIGILINVFPIEVSNNKENMMDQKKLSINNANCIKCLYKKCCKILLRPPVYHCSQYKESWNIIKGEK